jgi:trehalose utilization protein
VYHHSDVRRVIANGVAWAKSGRPRTLPTLLRYETDDFFNGHGYAGPIESQKEEQADARTS